MLISLLISTYNWEEALELCLYSALIQTVKPCEILIADDGSRDKTRNLIEKIQEKTPIPIIHVWHEDKGFRLSTIRNKAIKQAKGDYIIQIDGDIILSKFFISDHVELAKKGFFVCGSRVLLGKRYSTRILRGLEEHPTYFKQNIASILNAFRSRILRRFLSDRYANHRMNSIRGCNMAFWREDAFRVNGYNEELEMWGQEDVEFAYRLLYAGVQKRQLKMGGVQFHLFHRQSSKENLALHNQILQHVIENKITWCNNGIVKSTKKNK